MNNYTEIRYQTYSESEEPSVSKVLNLRETVTIYLHFFSFYRGQKLKLFSFFLTIEVILAGAFASLVSGVVEIANEQLPIIVIGAAASVVAVILFFLDQRITRLIGFTNQAIGKFEERYEGEFPPEMRLANNIKASMPNSNINILFTLSYGFFFVAGIAAILFAVIAL